MVALYSSKRFRSLAHQLNNDGESRWARQSFREYWTRMMKPRTGDIGGVGKDGQSSRFFTHKNNLDEK